MTDPVDLESLDAKKFQQFFSSFDTVLCDCDGVLVLYNVVLPGGKETIDLLREHGKNVAFVSNNSLQRTNDYRSKLTRMGFKPRYEDLVTPITVALDYFKRQNFSKKIYCISFHGLKEDLKEAGYQLLDARQISVDESSFESFVKGLDVLDSTVGAVYLDVDFMFSGTSIQKAIRYLQEPNVQFFGSGSDKIIPVNKSVQLMGPGYLHQVLEDITGKKPVLFGKPGVKMKEYLQTKVNDSSRTIFIGDSIDQDICFGKLCGFRTLLVLSGVTKNIDSEKTSTKRISPDYFVKNIDIFRLLIEKHLRYLKK